LAIFAVYFFKNCGKDQGEALLCPQLIEKLWH
jgi:hypothetical protein